MTHEPATASLTGGVALLERATNYALGCLHLVTPHALSNSTPCHGWDLRTLLRHMEASLTALLEAVEIGHVDLDPFEDVGDPTVDPVGIDPTETLRDRACRLLGAWVNADGDSAGRGAGHGTISIAGCSLATSIVTGAGALELAVHGWDIAQACGRHRPIPRSLAEEMFQLAPLFVTDADRPARFSPSVHVSPLADPGDRLIAFLGRHLG